MELSALMDLNMVSMSVNPIKMMFPLLPTGFLSFGKTFLMDGASRLTHLPPLKHVTILPEIGQVQKAGQIHSSSLTGF